MARLVVVETNEIPLSIYQWYAELRPGSTIARLLSDSVVGETQVFEEAGRELYPSQTWATFATGVPAGKHGVYWYGDPKPSEFPLYWQHVANHRSVGVVGVLHSSPLSSQADQPGIRFALPDAFASDHASLPVSLEQLQKFNLAMTRANARAVASTFPAADYARGLATVARLGLRPAALGHLGALAASVASRRAPKERLRTAQFMLLSEVFFDRLVDHDPDLAVFFTNHVAANLHRYWPASFPEDWSEHPYDEAWIDRFSGEIPFALDQLDRFLGRLVDHCVQTGRTLLMVSSMGQEGGGPVDEGTDRDLVVDDATRLAEILAIPGRHSPTFTTVQAMAPHVTYRLADEEEAAVAEQHLANIAVQGRRLVVDRAGDTVTITYHLRGEVDEIRVGSDHYQPTDAGFRTVAVSEHKAGRHSPYGAVVVANSPTAAMPSEPVDLEELAPAIIAHLGVEPLPHQVEPTLAL